jgi:hypothetical protein
VSDVSTFASRLTMSHGIAIKDRPLFLKIPRHGPEFTARSSAGGRRWAQIDRVDATLDERLEVGVGAVNSSARPLSAELERLIVDDLQGSMARDW